VGVKPRDIWALGRKWRTIAGAVRARGMLFPAVGTFRRGEAEQRTGAPQAARPYKQSHSNH